MRNRWLIALSAVGIHISIGSVYAWSVLTRPIMKEMGFSLAETTWTFSLAILFLGFSAGFLGSFVEKIGPKKSGLIAMTFFGTGMLGTAYAIAAQSLTLLYLFYGVIGGIGLGVGYITPVSTLVKYFPDHRGFATGLAIMGFGFAALIAGPVMQYLTATVGLVNNFLILGCVYMLIMGASSLYLKPPVLKDSTGKVTHIQQGVTANEALKTWQFASLWWIFFVNITCGIGLLAVASPMAQETIGMDAAAAASMVGIIGVFNGGGRIVWSTVSDYIGRGRVYMLFFLLEVLAFWQLGQSREACVFELLHQDRQQIIRWGMPVIILLSLPCVLGFNVWSGFQPFGPGSGVLELEDFLVSYNLLPLGSLVYLLFCMSRYGWGWNAFIKEANMGQGILFPTWLRAYLTWGLPLIVLAIFFNGYYALFFNK